MAYAAIFFVLLENVVQPLLGDGSEYSPLCRLLCHLRLGGKLIAFSASMAVSRCRWPSRKEKH